MLHLIDEDIAVQYLSAKKILRQRLALAQTVRQILSLHGAIAEPRERVE